MKEIQHFPKHPYVPFGTQDPLSEFAEMQDLAILRYTALVLAEIDRKLTGK
jgi:hypothetical protein